ncbi:MAG: DegV family protein [Ardenticatenia bacterium]|nr:DegV family protein [Ardenticatenia bacterium]
MIQVITDSTADLPPELAEQEGILVVPCQVTFGEKSFREGVDISGEAFFRRLRTSPRLPRTALPRGEDFEAAYREARARGATGVLAVHLGSRFSGLFNAARLVASRTGMPVELVDSGTASMALGLLALDAARLARQGMALSQLAGHVRQLAPRAETYAMLDTLEYVRRGGRINRVMEMAATALRIKPVLRVARNSVDVVTRQRTRQRALEWLAHRVTVADERFGVAVVHADAPELAGTLARAVGEHLAAGTACLRATAGAVLGTHAGPGAVGVCLIRRAPFTSA